MRLKRRNECEGSNCDYRRFSASMASAGTPVTSPSPNVEPRLRPRTEYRRRSARMTGSPIVLVRCRPAPRVLLTRSAAAPAAAEQHDPVAADLGRVALVAVLVVPLPRLQPAFDVDLLALRQVLVERSRRSCPRARRGAIRFFPGAGRPCRSRPRSSRGSASRPARRPACSAARRRARDCRPESLCSHCPLPRILSRPVQTHSEPRHFGTVQKSQPFLTRRIPRQSRSSRAIARSLRMSRLRSREICRASVDVTSVRPYRSSSRTTSCEFRRRDLEDVAVVDRGHAVDGLRRDVDGLAGLHLALDQLVALP